MGVSMIHVPYAGVASAVTGLIDGQVQVLLAAVAAPLPQIKAGKLKAIGFAGPERSPDVPTIEEQGFPRHHRRDHPNPGRACRSRLRAYSGCMPAPLASPAYNGMCSQM
jgi:hypothetical protein